MTSSKTGAVRVVLMLCAAVLAFGVWGTGMAGAATKTTVKVTKVPDVGSVLADSSGKTLYTLTDANGVAVECTGPCLTAWPAYMVTATKAKAPKGVKSIAISDTNQVTWKDLPLYTFSGDDAAKVAKGERPRELRRHLERGEGGQDREHSGDDHPEDQLRLQRLLIPPRYTAGCVELGLHHAAELAQPFQLRFVQQTRTVVHDAERADALAAGRSTAVRPRRSAAAARAPRTGCRRSGRRGARR